MSKKSRWINDETLLEPAKKIEFHVAYNQFAKDRSRLEWYQVAECTATWPDHQRFIQAK
jgi:hypothetical protein